MSTEPEWTSDVDLSDSNRVRGLTPEERAARDTANRASGQHLHNGAPSIPDPLTRVENGPVAKSVKYIPTPSLHPANVEKLEGIEGHEGYVRSAIDAFASIHGALQRLSDAREQAKKNGAWTEAQQILNVAAAAEKMQTAATLKFDTARKNLTDGIKSIEDMLNGPLAAKADNVLSSDIRKHLLRLPADKRAAEIERAIEEKELSVLQACLGAPPMLSGLSRELQQHYTRRYREATQPEQAQRLKVMRDALELVDKRAGLVFTETEKALGARWDVVKKLRTLDSDAQKALLLINEPAQP
jgi:hypothetical protein